MKTFVSLSLVAVVALSTACARAAEFSSGIAVGDGVPTYTTEKCAGAEDGIKVGQKLCYTWRLGDRPVVMVFAKNNAASLAGLVKKLDKLVADKKDSKLATVVNIMADDADKAKEDIAKLAEANEVKNVSLALTNAESSKNFKINPDADVTVMVYRDKKVTANHAVEAGKLDDKTIAAIVADAEKAAE